MIEKQIKIINKLGLHARAAAKLVTLAGSFESEISLHLKGKVANGKSIMSVMMLAACQGSDILFSINGTDENQAMSALEFLIKQRFDEKE